MLSLYIKDLVRLRSMYKMNDRQYRSVRQFFYPHIEPEPELSSIKLPLDVNWVLFFSTRTSEMENILLCTRNILEYMSGAEVVSRVFENKNTAVLYQDRD
jgi:hypothetical protein